MNHTIEELIRIFHAEDPNWSLDGLKNWLITRKQIALDVADAAIKAGVLDLDAGLKILTHHGIEGFDNHVLRIAQELAQKSTTLTTQMMQQDLSDKVSTRLQELEAELQARLSNLKEGTLKMLGDFNSAHSDQEKLLQQKLEQVANSYEEMLVKQVAVHVDKVKELESKIEAMVMGNRFIRALKVLFGK